MLRQEQAPPFKFKINLFVKNRDKHGLSDRELTYALTALLLTEYKAEKIFEIPDEKTKKTSDHKLTFQFEIPDKNNAISCFRDIN